MTRSSVLELEMRVPPTELVVFPPRPLSKLKILRKRRKKRSIILLCICLLILLIFYRYPAKLLTDFSAGIKNSRNNGLNQKGSFPKATTHEKVGFNPHTEKDPMPLKPGKRPPFPHELRWTKYKPTDFQNFENHMDQYVPSWNDPYNLGFRWVDHEWVDVDSFAAVSTMSDDTVPISTDNYYDKQVVGIEEGNARKGVRRDSWGPCFPPSNYENVDWHSEMHALQTRNGTEIEYPDKPRSYQSNLDGMCRPGFLIVGAGKCGTSSLYHYLTGHDRVLEAKKKQVDYFRFYLPRGMHFYLSHFPTTKYFLSSGALITGEASPGYLPYPNVAHETFKQMSGTKLIMIVREPLDRAWSSYNYNYVNPALFLLKKGRGTVKSKTPIPKGKSSEYYKSNHLFSFEEMIRAELTLLKTCLKPGGIAETKAREKYYKWAHNEYARRNETQLPTLQDPELCYGEPVGGDSPRKQWNELVQNHPQKLIKVKNLQLVEALVGRGLYTLPIEWWYAAGFPSEDIHLVCLENLKDAPTKTMDDISTFLGLPKFDFTEVVSEGAFNVAGHRGYGEITSWEVIKAKQKLLGETNIGTKSSTQIPISDELKKEFLDFASVYNERLFQQMGKRCPW